MPTTIAHPASSRCNSDDTLPPDLDPEIHPIIATHIYGVGPHGRGKPGRAILDLAFQRAVERLHQLGPRSQCELLREIGDRYGCRAFIEERLKRYAELDPEIVAALGGDVFPPAPIRQVG